VVEGGRGDYVGVGVDVGFSCAPVLVVVVPVPACGGGVVLVVTTSS